MNTFLKMTPSLFPLLETHKKVCKCFKVYSSNSPFYTLITALTTKIVQINNLIIYMKRNNAMKWFSYFLPDKNK